MDGVEDAPEDTESVLAAYRERKRRALAAKEQAGEEAPAPRLTPASHESPGAPTPASAAAPRASPAVVTAETTPVAQPPVTPPVANAPSTQSPPAHAAAPASTGRELDISRSAVMTSRPGATLSPLGPALRLSSTLLKDTKVSMRGSPKVRAGGILVALLGLGILVLERRQASLGQPIPQLSLVVLLFLVGGVLLAVAGMFLPKGRRLAVRLAASQKEEWKRIQGETTRLLWAGRIGLGASVLGLLMLAAGYAILSSPLWILGSAVTVVGIVTLVVTQVRRSLARRLYVQTLVLSGLEATGLGSGSDERVQPVILALDQLLGALPEKQVQAFLQTPEARAYLELVDEATRSQRES